MQEINLLKAVSFTRLKSLTRLVMAARWLRPRAATCSIEEENRFGPIVSDGCASGFDFTWFFETVILSLPVTLFFLLWAVIRINSLRKKTVKTQGGYWGISKLVYHFVPFVILYRSNKTSDSICRYILYSDGSYRPLRITIG